MPWFVRMIMEREDTGEQTTVYAPLSILGIACPHEPQLYPTEFFRYFTRPGTRVIKETYGVLSEE